MLMKNRNTKRHWPALKPCRFYMSFISWNYNEFELSFCIAQGVKLTLAEWIKSITASSIMDDPQVFTEFMEVYSELERGANVQVKNI